MIWNEISPYCLQSDCKGYTVTKIGSARGWSYEAWRYSANLAVGCQKADAAKEICETHLRQQQVAA